MFTNIQVFRVEFDTRYGSSSDLIAVDDIADIGAAIKALGEKIGGTPVSISDSCVMTPVLYTKDFSSET